MGKLVDATLVAAVLEGEQRHVDYHVERGVYVPAAEVDRVRRAGNYGWNVKEGTHCFDAENNRVSPPDCPRASASSKRARSSD